MTSARLNVDFHDFLVALNEEGVEFLVVGAYALAAHGTPRATGDLDVLVRPSEENARRVLRALARFGAPVTGLGITVDDLSDAGTVCQIGVPPRRIDVLTEISGVTFEEAWESRIAHEVDGIALAFPSRDRLIQNKRATGRPKDLADVEELERGR